MTDPRPRRPDHSRKLERAQSGTARAALLGVSDGLVTNVSLILGVFGAGTSTNLVRLAGLASLIAGACSMAVGEYISMRGQAELLASILDAEREELHSDPAAARATLTKLLIRDGVTKSTAAAAAAEISHDPERTMRVYARGQLGVNPDELGSAWGSAISSFVMFSLGALVPLLPWFIGGGLRTAIISLILAAVSALGIGAYLGATTNGRWLWSAARQLLVLILAAGATYLIGLLFHTNAA